MAYPLKRIEDEAELAARQAALGGVSEAMFSGGKGTTPVSAASKVVAPSAPGAGRVSIPTPVRPTLPIKAPPISNPPVTTLPIKQPLLPKPGVPVQIPEKPVAPIFPMPIVKPNPPVTTLPIRKKLPISILPIKDRKKKLFSDINLKKDIEKVK